jgi:glutathione S-transferase
MYTLYYSPGAASLAVHWMLIEIGAPHELVKLDLAAGEQRRPEYLALNPNGVVPTLVVDGTPMTECAAILLYLAERHPETAFAPPAGSPARLPYLQWMVHMTNTQQAAFRQWFYAAGPAGEENAERVKASVRSVIEGGWDRVDAWLAAQGPYMAGDRVTATDFMTTMLMRWSRNMPRPATDWPAIVDYVARMKLRPAFRRLYEVEGLTEWS